MTDRAKRPDIIVPEEASGRGPFLRGELRNDQLCCPDVLAQFEQIAPHTRKSRIHLLLSAEQAKRLLVVNGPLEFEGSFSAREGAIETRIARDIWPKPITQITHEEAFYWTQNSGRIGSLESRTRFLPGPELDSRKNPGTAWFVARPCFALQIIANDPKEEAEHAARFGISKSHIAFNLSDGASASIHRYLRFHRPGALRDLKRNGYSILVEGIRDPFAAKRDVDALLLLASFASRQRTLSTHWSYETKGEWVRLWQFNIGKFRKRFDGEGPVVPRDRDECRAFLQTAFDKYSSSIHQPLLDAAIYALLSHDMTLEVNVARLFSAIQGALYFATQWPLNPKQRPRIGDLYRGFLAAHPGIFDGLWPLLGSRTDASLYYLRNTIVHGEAFSEVDWTALSYAGEHLRWHLERIILAALGWGIEKSTVSARALSLFTAYQS